MIRRFRFIIFMSIVTVISLGMHWPHFSKELMGAHVWRQTQTQSTIHGFYSEDMNILNPRRNERGNGDGIFRMEFPLMQWITAALYKLFGNHLIITRLLMFITGLFSVAGMYKLIKTVFRNEKMGFIGAWAFNFSPSFYYYTINPLPDNLALCCSIWGLAFFFVWYRDRHMQSLMCAGLLLSIGALCKLPFIIYYIVPFVYFITEIRQQGINKRLLLNATTVFGFVLLPVAWYLSVVGQWQGNGIVQGMFDNKTGFSTIADYLIHNLISTLPELLLNYGSVVFFIAAFWFIIKNKTYRNFLFPVFAMLSIAILCYFLFEINMIEKVHDYYLFPFYPVLFMLVAYGAWQVYQLNDGTARYLTLFLLLILPLTAWLRMSNKWNPDQPGFNRDLLIYKTELRAAVPDNALCIVGNDLSHFIFLYYADKKGWAFDHNSLKVSQLQSMMNDGAKYLYTDAREVDNNPDIKQHLDSMMMEKGSIRVYRLK